MIHYTGMSRWMEWNALSPPSFLSHTLAVWGPQKTKTQDLLENYYWFFRGDEHESGFRFVLERSLGVF